MCQLGHRDLLRISIHALREEGDSHNGQMDGIWDIFLSTPSARRATAAVDVVGHIDVISIHALREEGDPLIRWQTPTWAYFYPRPPRGGRHVPAVS